jgi:hypothetical protein
MMFVTLTTLVVKMRHLRTRCDTYNTGNDDTCDTIKVSNFEVQQIAPQSTKLEDVMNEVLCILFRARVRT